MVMCRRAVAAAGQTLDHDPEYVATGPIPTAAGYLMKPQPPETTSAGNMIAAYRYRAHKPQPADEPRAHPPTNLGVDRRPEGSAPDGPAALPTHTGEEPNFFWPGVGSGASRS